MRTYRNATIITALLTIGSFFVAAYLNFWIAIDPFWCNLLLGVFGSSVLTFLTSIVGYRVERRKTFEGFSYFSYESIYHPLLLVNQKIGHHIWHFRWHKDGSGRNEQVMKKFIQEIEDLIIETTVEEYPNLEDLPEDMRDDIEVNTISTTRNKLVEDVQKELIGKYYCYMYGNRAKPKTCY